MQPITTQHIELRNNLDGQPRAYLAGTRIRVQDVYAQSEVFGQTPDEIVSAFPHLTLAQVHAALAYYFDHRKEILDEIRQDDEFVAMVKAQTGPGPMERKLRGEVSGEGPNDALPSG